MNYVYRVRNAKDVFALNPGGPSLAMTQSIFPYSCTPLWGRNGKKFFFKKTECLLQDVKKPCQPAVEFFDAFC
ncbi:hypothetical protein CSB45_01225 [candidate division KSB3 bacterium]|uniref:Uncharacterized protein n=1 Tax=candidate division KSB3 bacterium TaxID=2044937 RepID=A0A2G6EBC5_9BACT|nr:MAG: hypothetical protein CSB45_01225 [candidate division KSB3 bacterium]PIE30780.1 MAG: hypothetical protein CSA57_02125 [candidate division KSB3 bacterium]